MKAACRSLLRPASRRRSAQALAAGHGKAMSLAGKHRDRVGSDAWPQPDAHELDLPHFGRELSA
jgi:hypothetical protein